MTGSDTMCARARYAPKTRVRGNSLMTFVRARKRPGARSALRAVICGLGGVLALMAGGCGNNQVNNGTLVLTLRDTRGDFTAYRITVGPITLTATDGSIAEPLAAQESVDLTHLTDLTELVGAPAVGVRTYTSASI